MGFSDTVATMGWTKAADITYMSEPYQVKIPLNMHIGCMGLAPASHDSVDSIPPMPTGGNLDDKRIGKGTTMYYPVEVAGGLLSMGDAHAAQGDSELDGTGIETSITGTFKITVIKASAFTKPWMGTLDLYRRQVSNRVCFAACAFMCSHRAWCVCWAARLARRPTRGSFTRSRSATTWRRLRPTRATGRPRWIRSRSRGPCTTRSWGASGESKGRRKDGGPGRAWLTRWRSMRGRPRGAGGGEWKRRGTRRASITGAAGWPCNLDLASR